MRLPPALIGHAVDEERPRQADRIDTVKDLMEVWLGSQELRADLSPRTLNIYRLAARHVVAEVGDVLLTRMSLLILDRLRDNRLRAGNAARTVELDSNILRRAWRWGKARGLCPDRPLPRAELEVSATRGKYTPTREEFWKVVDEMEGWPRLCLLLLGATGARIGEVANMRWEDINLDSQTLKIPVRVGSKKKKEVREVSLPYKIIERLRAAWPTHGRGRVLPVTPDTARTSITQRYLKAACQAAEVHYFTPHGVRRMVIDQYYDNGVDVGTVAAQLGQSPKVALAYYRKARPTTKRRAVALAGIGERTESTIIEQAASLRKKPEEAHDSCSNM